MIYVYLFIGLVIAQRLAEVVVAKSNERWMKERGAFEAGASHYPVMVALHSCFFVSLLVEVTVESLTWSIWSVLPLVIFLLAQIIRVWALVSLGRYWNTKIIVLPDADPIQRGPYRWIRHPNYLVVVLEILFLPLIFQAYVTAILFSLFNVVMLMVRVKIEEEALDQDGRYQEKFHEVGRFMGTRKR
ncbi:isoprenylcysteine carboxyl methyltransferase family protein [Alkalicoccobacillus porphyridii]|uniref:Isoprenylcysteine carboxyl methyltransferase n=1 Tax=Alkalicoccobacillus porphyridii TaxID=2597270 RepID=A0A553ZVY9_9BACI|nr:isoprenylcysteine carboxyl methyltransferase family protein [Alkalicoccobacillus porphyridii]TSB45639.1 isoprenylcysteine carboxyl methyltransferase [Alkalicoccobacillus porphyridii]